MLNLLDDLLAQGYTEIWSYPGVLLSKPVYRTSRFWGILVPAALLLILLIAFQREVNLFFRFVAGGSVLPADLILAAEMRRATLIILVNFFAFFFFLIGYLFMVSQFVLPVQTAEERREIFERILRYLTASHGPAVFVHEGEVQGSKAELVSSLPGVAFVDLKSAIVLERQPFIVYKKGKVQSEVGIWETLKMLWEMLEIEYHDFSYKPKVYAEGPGLVFTPSMVKIRGTVSLRRHSRGEKGIQTLTRDGFEIKGGVNTTFSLGEAPEVLLVGYILQDPTEPDPFVPKNLRVFRINERTMTIDRITDEMDLADKREIHIFAQNPRVEPYPQPPARPYRFYPDRVFTAVYSDAKRINDGSIEQWQDMPLRVAIETFHNMIASTRYLDLYMPKDPQDYPFARDFQPRFAQAMRNQGILAFQLVTRKDNRPLEMGQAWNENDFEIYPAQSLHNSKVLRDRGIRVISASVSELVPVKMEVRQQLLDYWRSHRDYEADSIRAPYDYEQIAVQGRTRALAQGEIINRLQGIYDDTSLTPEMMAIRLLQEIEGFAKDPATSRLLPGETISMVDNLHRWMWGNR